jgi:hypothetical protein
MRFVNITLDLSEDEIDNEENKNSAKWRLSVARMTCHFECQDDDAERKETARSPSNRCLSVTVGSYSLL